MILTDNGRGDLVFTRGRGPSDRKLRFILKRRRDKKNNIKRANRKRNDSKRFNYYLALSQPQKGTLKQIPTYLPGTLIANFGDFFDNSIRTSRKYFFITENPSDFLQCSLRARWESNVRKGRSNVYTATTEGHTFKSSKITKVWAHNNFVTIRDDILDTEKGIKYLITAVRYTQNLGSGSETTLTCMSPEVYNLPQRVLTEERFPGVPVGPA